MTALLSLEVSRPLADSAALSNSSHEFGQIYLEPKSQFKNVRTNKNKDRNKKSFIHQMTRGILYLIEIRFWIPMPVERAFDSDAKFNKHTQMVRHDNVC